VGAGALEDGCLADGWGATDVDGPGAGAALSGHASTTTGTIIAAAATTSSAIPACLVRYQGSGGRRNVKVLLSEARSWPLTVHVVTVAVGTRRGGAGATSARAAWRSSAALTTG
jgi:hypothetical protein